MSDIFPDRNIVDEINSNRGSSAEQKIQFRIMQALESIAESAAKIANPIVTIPPKQIPLSGDALDRHIVEDLGGDPTPEFPAEPAERDRRRRHRESA